MIDNAVQHYNRLVEQGIAPERAVDHVRQRFGIDAPTLAARVAGGVADPAETRRVLSLVRDRFDNDSDAYADCDLLAQLYRAVTGEDVTPPDDACGHEYICHDCGRANAPYSGLCETCLARRGDDS